MVSPTIGIAAPDNETLMNQDALTGTPDSPVDITGINAVSFPYILSYVTVNTTDGRTGKLQRDDFQVYENGKQMNISFFPSSDNTTRAKLDLVILFDDTGSLGDEIADLKEKVNEVTDRISSAKIDCRYALITFKDTVSIKQEWTPDQTVIKKAVDDLSASGGDDAPEVDLDAIEASLGLGFRPDAQHMILDITDEKTHYRDDGTQFSNYTIPETANHLMEMGVSYILVGPTSVEGVLDAKNDKRELVSALGANGLFFDIHTGDFSVILDKILAIFTQTYTLGYNSPDTNTDKIIGTVLVKVGDDTDSGQYIAAITDVPVISDGITPADAQPCSQIPINIPGKNFKPGASARLFTDTDTLQVSNISVTSSSLSGTLVIPCDIPAGLFNLEVTNPDGKVGVRNNVFTIQGSGQKAQKDSTSPAGTAGKDSTWDSSNLQAEEAPIQNGCEGWEDDSGYHLITRVVPSDTPAERIPNPWCWCNGFPYNKNHQTCVPMQE